MIKTADQGVAHQAPQTFEEWRAAFFTDGRDGDVLFDEDDLRTGWDAAIASQQATVESLNARLDEYGAKYATLNAVRHDLGLPADADEDAMRDKVQWLTFEHRSLTAQLAEKEAEIERLKALPVTAEWLADHDSMLVSADDWKRYEAVVEAARAFFEVVDQVNARGGTRPAPLRIVQVQGELRAALAALEEKPA